MKFIVILYALLWIPAFILGIEIFVIKRKLRFALLELEYLRALQHALEKGSDKKFGHIFSKLAYLDGDIEIKKQQK